MSDDRKTRRPRVMPEYSDDGATAKVTPLHREDVAPAERERSSFWPQDLTAALAGEPEQPATILRRTDGKALLYPGKTHAFIGETESAKTWAAAVAAVEVLTAGGMVLWIDYEDTARTLVARLLALGLPAQTIRERLHYVHPTDPTEYRDGAVTGAHLDMVELLTAHTYALAVIDGVTDGMVTEGLDPLGTDDAAKFTARIAKRLAAAGPAVVSLDHVPKSAENRGRFSLGSQHKVSGLTGAAYVFETRRPISRATTEPVDGEVVVKVTKDRPGMVRSGLNGGVLAVVGVLQLTAYPDGGLTAKLVPAAEAAGVPPAATLRRIYEYLSVYPGATVTKVRENVKGNNEDVGDALLHCIAQAYVTVEVRGRSHLHTLTEAGREYLSAL